jgi:hypothetical protein
MSCSDRRGLLYMPIAPHQGLLRVFWDMALNMELTKTGTLDITILLTSINYYFSLEFGACICGMRLYSQTAGLRDPAAKSKAEVDRPRRLRNSPRLGQGGRGQGVQPYRRAGVPTVCATHLPLQEAVTAHSEAGGDNRLKKKRTEHSLQSIIHHDRVAAQLRPKLPPAFHASPSPLLIMHSSRSRCSRPPTRIATRACGP